MLQKFYALLNGNYNAREIKRVEKYVPMINVREEEYQALSDEELKAKFSGWRTELTEDPEKVDVLMVDVFAGVKNAARRLCGKSFEVRGKEQEWNMTPFDVQLIGGIVLHEGKISEMKTGEGKTLVCTLPVILNALVGKEFM